MQFVEAMATATNGDHTFESDDVKVSSHQEPLLIGGRTPIERYENKVQEMSTMAVISALLFGFSVSMWIDFDSSSFTTDPKSWEILWAYLFTVSAMLTLITSALSTVVEISIIISFRRLIFKYGVETDWHSLVQFKRKTHCIRGFVRVLIYVAFVGMIGTLALYSIVKWSCNGLRGVSVSLAAIGMIVLIVIERQIHRAYAVAEHYNDHFDYDLEERMPLINGKE